ncbi:hypothetical protein Taro_049590, partial [Colocasia esculenta]|nr:hypothetical protein [Colocasia esculenta]
MERLEVHPAGLCEEGDGALLLAVLRSGGRPCRGLVVCEAVGRVELECTAGGIGRVMAVLLFFSSVVVCCWEEDSRGFWGPAFEKVFAAVRSVCDSSDFWEDVIGAIDGTHIPVHILRENKHGIGTAKE